MSWYQFYRIVALATFAVIITVGGGLILVFLPAACGCGVRGLPVAALGAATFGLGLFALAAPVLEKLRRPSGDYLSGAGWSLVSICTLGMLWLGFAGLGAALNGQLGATAVFGALIAATFWLLLRMRRAYMRSRPFAPKP